MAEPRHWFDPSQPQTLQGAVMLCYITAAFSVLWVLFGVYPLVISLGLGIAGYGVANERRWGYWLGIVLAGLTSLVLILFAGALGGIILNLLFMGVLIALLLHPQSREYQRVWFK
jgi:H+/Cl- antiporter ClcA